MNQFRKAIVAVLGAITIAVSEGLLPEDVGRWVTVITPVLTALGVFGVSNEEPDERGAVDPGSCALGLLLGLLAGYLLWKNGI